MTEELNPTQEPITEGNPDLDAILGEGNFDMDDDGEIQIGAPDASTTPATPAASGTEPPVEPAAPQHNWEERYKNLEPEFTRKSQRLSELEKTVLPGMQSQLDHLTGRLEQVTGGEAKPGTDQIEIPDDLGNILNTDPVRGAAIIADISDHVVERRLMPILERVAPMLEDWELETELRETAMKPGREDFFQLLPQVRKAISESETELSFENAYRLVKTFHKVDNPPPTPTDEPTGVAPQAPQAPSTERISVEEAQQIASRLKPDTSTSGEVQPDKRVVDSVEDAFELAVEEHFGD